MSKQMNLHRVLPPPLYYAAGLLIGFVLNRWRPLTFPDTAFSEAAGALLIVVSIVLVFLAIPQFRKHGTALDVYKPTSALVTSGVYRFTRNPMYLALTLLYLGFAISFENLWMLFLVILPLAAVRFLNIGREEAELEHQFGEEYVSYKGRVRRWI